jgi:hypothetical protein
LQRRSFTNKRPHWQLDGAKRLDYPSKYEAPYAYIGQHHKLYQLNVETAVIRQQCFEQADSSYSFYLQQSPTIAERSTFWHQSFPDSCQLSFEGWKYRVFKGQTAKVFLGNRGDSAIYQVHSDNYIPSKWKTLEAPLKVLLQHSNNYQRSIYVAGENLYSYNAENDHTEFVPLAAAPIFQSGFESLLTYQHPYIAYLNQIHPSTSDFNITFQKIVD